MGIFDSFKQAKAESPGRVMMIFLKDAVPAMASMNDAMREQILRDFCGKRENLLPRLSNMTIEGLLKTSKDFTVAGNRLKRAAPLDGYPLLLTGMWLESRYRPGEDAASVHKYLNALALEHGGSVLY